jgi:hypothetical protein
MKRRVKNTSFIFAVSFLVMLFPLFVIADTGDGSVLSVVKIQDNGPDTQRFNIVIMGDGYQTSEIATFETQAQAVVTAFNAMVGFGPCGSAVNFYRVNIESDDSGVDKPADCYDPAVYKDTYLDTHYCAYGTQRCIWSSNTALVQTTAWSATPNWHFIVVLVNDTEHGGCAGSGMTFNCTSENFEQIVMHELGHAIGGLADEYEEFVGTYSGGEPGEANITTATNRADLKWRDLVLATTPVPTWEKTDCSLFQTPPLSWNSIVGTYEGGDRSYTCGVFRPVPNCLMRSLSYDFCPVCVKRIQKVLMIHYSESNLSITPWGYYLNPPTSPLWQTPDIWCDNNGNNIQEPDEPSIGKADNHLFARVTNTGNADSEAFQVRFSYVPYTGVIDLANEQLIQTISRPSLGVSLTDEVEVLWDLTSIPSEFEGVDHFCVIVEIIADECATYDNNAQNNFGSVPTVGPAPAPISLYIKNILDVDAVGAIIIDPSPASWQIIANVPDLNAIPLKPKEEKLITIDFKYLKPCQDTEVVKKADVSDQPRICTRENFDITYKLNGQVLGGVSSEIIVHIPKRKCSLSLHAGKTYPIRNYGNFYDSGLMVAFDFGYRLRSQLSLVGVVGYNKFPAAVPTVADTSWWNVSVNLKFEFSTNPVRPYVNFGPGIYFPKSGSVKAGLNLGCGVDISIAPVWVAEAGVDYHRIFTTGYDVEFLDAHVGLIYRF